LDKQIEKTNQLIVLSIGVDNWLTGNGIHLYERAEETKQQLYQSLPVIKNESS
jgi:hypothetical protein